MRLRGGSMPAADPLLALLAAEVARDLGPATAEEIDAEVARRLAAAEGDVRRCLADGGLAVTRALTRAGEPGDVPALRPMAEGRYTDFFPVGRGGMGIVYWALDTELSRQIAFKVIAPTGGDGENGATPAAPLELGTPEPASPDAPTFDGARWRLLQEAWVTGGMDHPGIVPVYELGETSGGVPYYTMRFVRGNRTLRDAIESAKDVAVGARLELLLEPFLKVCDTVRYAHSRGVIHRDLKPENVALGEYGEVVVLDWGLARVEGPLDTREDPWADRVTDLRADGALHTVASALGTPGYLSPEAARGETNALDERSDVYALGVVLFQILTGRLPFSFQKTDEYLDKVVSQAPPDPGDLVEGVPARLALLCTRALAREPDDRPESANAFAEAIRLWRTEAAQEREIDVLLGQATSALATAADLRGEDLLRELDRATAACRRVLDLRSDQPRAKDLLARAERMRERGIEERERQARRRTLRRFGAAVLGVGVVAAVLVALLLEARRREATDARRQAEQAKAVAETSQARAEADRARAEDVMKFMVFELQESLEPIGRLDVLARIGATARDYYANLPSEGLSPQGLVGHTVTLRRLGEVSEARGDLPAAIEAYRLAGEVAERLLEHAPADPVGRYHRSLAEAKIANALFRQGYASDAWPMLVAHRDDVIRLLEEHPDDPEYLGALGAAHAAAGFAFRTQRQWPEAREAYRLALAATRALERDHPKEERWTRDRLQWQLALANLEFRAGSEDESHALIEQTLAECLEQQIARALGRDVRWMTLEAVCRHRLARVAAHGGRTDDALWVEAYEIADRLRALDPENAARSAHLVMVQVFRSESTTLRGEYEEALIQATEAFEVCEALTERDPSNASWLNILVTLCDRVATLGVKLNLGVDHDCRYRRLAADHAARLVALDPSYPHWRHIQAYALGQLGRALSEVDPEEAQRLLEQSLRIVAHLVEETPGAYELVVLQTFAWEKLALLHAKAGRHAEAVREVRRALATLSRFWAQHSDRYEVIGHLLATHARLSERLSEGAAEEQEEAVDVLEAGIELGEEVLAREGDADSLVRTTVEDHVARLRRALKALTMDDE